MIGSGNNVGELLREAERNLQELDTARLDAEVLLRSVLSAGREWLYAHPEHEVPPGLIRDYFALINRRREGFPLAYLIGRREFWSLDLEVNRYTLIPRPETEGLVEIALDLIRGRPNVAILDLGTGCGAIAIALAHERPDCRIIATDISREALAVARQNAQRLAIRNIEFRQSDWFSDLGFHHFGLIVCNPPYIDAADRTLAESEIRFEPRLALDGGHGGVQALNAVVNAATRYLASRGVLVLEHGCDQGANVRSLFSYRGYAVIETICDGAGLERITYGRWE